MKPFSCEEQLRELGKFRLEKRQLCRNLTAAFQYLQRGHQGDGARLFAVPHGGRMRDNEYKLKLEIQNGCKEKLFHPEDSQAVREAAQRGCTTFILQVLQDRTGQSSEKPGLTSRLTPVWAAGWTGDLWRSLPTWVILGLLCNILPHVLQFSVHTVFPEGYVCYGKEAEWNKHDSRGGGVKCSPLPKSFWVSSVVMEVHTRTWWKGLVTVLCPGTSSVKSSFQLSTAMKK